MAKLTKKLRILIHLLQRRSITPREAIDLYKSYRLAAVVCQLKKEGHDIRTKLLTQGDATFAEYSIVPRGELF